MPKSIPQLTETELRGSSTIADQKPEQQERQIRVFSRLDQMIEFKRPYEIQMERSYMLYDGISRLDPKKPPLVEHADIVQPFAAIFVETKTAEEFSATSDFEFMPVDDADDVWKAELLKDVLEHVRRKTMYLPNKLDGTRTKNIAGVNIKRKGYKLIMRTLKECIEEDEFGRMVSWKEVEVPWYDDIYEELVDPFDFVVDPNATTMNNAVDCGHFHQMNWEDAFELFGKDPRFDFDGVKPGMNNMVQFCEYFNAPRDEWVIYAWPSSGTRYSMESARKPGACKEVYHGPLPDKHKMLPFTSEHCDPAFTTGFFTEVIGRSPESGEEAGISQQVIGRRVFWTQGVPVTIADLIDLRTDFGRQALEMMRAAGTNIIATKENKRFNNKRKWKNGDQAVGMMGNFQIETGGTFAISAFQFTFDDLYQLMIQRVGVDPRNLTDTKQKTLGEDQAQRESSARRLNAGILYNEIVEGYRDGVMTFHLIQQHYTKPELVRLTGSENEEELKRFDEVLGEHPSTGGPLIGKRYRRIRTSKPMSEFKAGTKNMLKAEHQGKYSFLSRPEYTRCSEMDIAIVPKRRAGQIQALMKAQAREDVELLTIVLPLTQPGPNGEPPLLSMDEVPNARRIIEKWIVGEGGNPIKDIGQDKKNKKDKKLDEALAKQKQRKALNAVPTGASPMIEDPSKVAPVPVPA